MASLHSADRSAQPFFVNHKLLNCKRMKLWRNYVKSSALFKLSRLSLSLVLNSNLDNRCFLDHSIGCHMIDVKMLSFLIWWKFVTYRWPRDCRNNAIGEVCKQVCYSWFRISQIMSDAHISCRACTATHENQFFMAKWDLKRVFQQRLYSVKLSVSFLVFQQICFLFPLTFIYMLT